MTVDTSERIEMAEADDLTLDELFGLLEQMPVPEGFRVEIVEGAIYMSPQRDTHWEIIRRVVRALEDRFGMDLTVFSDVRIDFPGRKNGLCPDVALLDRGASKTSEGRWRYQDVAFVTEVISRETAANDYGAKKTAYAQGPVPVYLVIDPYTAECHVYTDPRNGEYRSVKTYDFGEKVDLADTPAGFVLSTADLPREEA